MNSTVLVATVALGQMFHCSAAPELLTTLAPTPDAQYVSIVNNNATPFDFDLILKDDELKIISKEDHQFVSKGEDRLSTVPGVASSIFVSSVGPCPFNQTPCVKIANIAKNADGSLVFIMTTARAVKLRSVAPNSDISKPLLVVVHGICKLEEAGK